jgi:putative nucleotidyltransferase with HDIG domain
MAEHDKTKGTAELITRLSVAIQNAGMYPEDHPQVADAMEEAFDELGHRLKTEPQITIVILGENILVDRKPLIVPHTYKAAFLRVFNKMGIERLTFRRGLDFREFADFIRGLSASGLLPLESSAHVILGRLQLKKPTDEADRDVASDEPLLTDAEEIHDIWSQSPEHMLEGVYQNIVEKKQIDRDMVDGIVIQLIKSIPRETNPLRLLSSIKSMDEYTFVHTVNVGILTMSLAQSLGFRGADFYKIGVAAILHDVGKITIPREILSKKGALTSEERHIMESHPISGAMHLLDLKNVSNLAVLTAMEHHVKFDGTGYPQMKKPWKTNIVSQMITVADFFDALRTKRPYRDPMAQIEVARIMTAESGTTFNPYLVERFLDMIGKP